MPSIQYVQNVPITTIEEFNKECQEVHEYLDPYLDGKKTPTEAIIHLAKNAVQRLDQYNPHNISVEQTESIRLSKKNLINHLNTAILAKNAFGEEENFQVQVFKLGSMYSIAKTAEYLAVFIMGSFVLRSINIGPFRSF